MQLALWTYWGNFQIDPVKTIVEIQLFTLLNIPVIIKSSQMSQNMKMWNQVNRNVYSLTVKLNLNNLTGSYWCMPLVKAFLSFFCFLFETGIRLIGSSVSHVNIEFRKGPSAVKNFGFLIDLNLYYYSLIPPSSHKIYFSKNKNWSLRLKTSFSLFDFHTSCDYLFESSSSKGFLEYCQHIPTYR